MHKDGIPLIAAPVRTALNRNRKLIARQYIPNSVFSKQVDESTLDQPDFVKSNHDNAAVTKRFRERQRSVSPVTTLGRSLGMDDDPRGSKGTGFFRRT